MQLGCQPVAVVKYTFTNKQYTERHKTNNTWNNTTIFGTVRAVPRLCKFYPGICLKTEEKARKTLSQSSNKSIIAELSFIKFDIRKYLPISRLSQTELI